MYSGESISRCYGHSAGKFSNGIYRVAAWHPMWIEIWSPHWTWS